MIKTTNNKRYKRLEYNNKAILLDMDSNKITWLFPFLAWFFPLNGYAVSKNYLADPVKEGRKVNTQLIAPIVAVLALKMSKKGIGLISSRSSLILLPVSMLIIFIIRYYFRYKKNELHLEGEKYSVKLEFTGGAKAKFKYFIKMFFCLSVFYIAGIWCAVLFVSRSHNLMELSVFLMCEYFILVAATLMASPVKGCQFFVKKV